MSEGTKLIALLLTATLAATACSSTSDRATEARADRGSADRAAGSDPSDTRGAEDETGGTELGTPSPKQRSSGQISGGGTESGAQDDGTTGTRSAAGPGSASQGVTPEEIFIGISTAEDFDSVAAAYGISGSDSSSDRAKADAVVAAINDAGGIAGRKLVAVFHDISAAGNFDSEAQAACAKWTQDNKVFAALAWLYDRDTLVSCLAKRNTPLLKSSFQLYDSAFAERFPDHFYQHDFLFGDRWGIYVDRLVALGQLKPADRIGLLRLDTPEHERTSDGTVKPQLQAHGLGLVDEIAIKKFNGASDAVSDTASAVGNAVLRFRSQNIDRVLILDIGGVLAQFFMSHAESQGYRPRYGLNSINRPQFLVENVPAAQLAGSVGAGWWPIEDEGKAGSGHAGEKQCTDVLRRAGQDPNDFSGLSYCSRLFFLKAALDGAHDITPAGLQAAVDGLGSSFSSALTPQTSYSGRRADGVSAVRDFAYDPGCRCFKYTSGPHPLP